MTTPTLPTREDGGVDWGQFSLMKNGSVLVPWLADEAEDRVGAGRSYPVIEFARLVAAHERVRCAQRLEQTAERCFKNAEIFRPPHAAPNEELAYLHDQLGTALQAEAAEFRKMEP